MIDQRPDDRKNEQKKQPRPSKYLSIDLVTIEYLDNHPDPKCCSEENEIVHGDRFLIIQYKDIFLVEQ